MTAKSAPMARQRRCGSGISIVLTLVSLILLLLSLTDMVLAQSKNITCPSCTFITLPLNKCNMTGKMAIPMVGDSTGWTALATQMAQCVCPTFASSAASQCLSCLSTDWPSPSYVLLGQLVPACFADDITSAATILRDSVLTVDLTNVTTPKAPNLTQAGLNASRGLPLIQPPAPSPSPNSQSNAFKQFQMTGPTQWMILAAWTSVFALGGVTSALL